MPGGGVRGMKRSLAAVAGVLVLWLCSTAQAQPPYAAPPPTTPGSYILVPHGRSYVYVPLDASGLPTNVPGMGSNPPTPSPSEPAPRFWYSPETPAAPPVPRAPSSPPVPPVPRAPGAPTVGYLQTEIEPAGAQVLIDGRRAGVADAFGSARTLFALEVGMHRIEIVQAGYRPLRTEIRVVPRAVFSIRARLEAK